MYDKETNKFNSSLRSDSNITSEFREFNFKSLNVLRTSVEKNASKLIHEILQSMNFVGFVNRELALIQHQTALYLTNTRLLSEELFYQLALFNFGNFGYYKLAEPVLITGEIKLLHIAIILSVLRKNIYYSANYIIDINS